MEDESMEWWSGDVVELIDPTVGTGGDTPNGSGGMIPSTAPPFAMTRWTAQTRENFVSSTPYNQTDSCIHGFQAIWMGESGQVVVHAGLGEVKPAFKDRGLPFSHSNETLSATSYKVEMDAGNGSWITGEHASTSRVGHLRYTFHPSSSSLTPYILFQSTRKTIITSDPTNITSVLGGTLSISPSSNPQSLSGSNPERQDSILVPTLPASSFSTYYHARFSLPFTSWGTSNGPSLHPNSTSLTSGDEVSGWVAFPPGTKQVEVWVGTSFISEGQAKRNLETEVGAKGRTLEETERETRGAWREKLERIKFGGKGGKDGWERGGKWERVFYTGFWHSLQYPYEVSEEGRYYSGYDDTVHDGISYSGYSIWDTYRAEWPWLILFAPERVSGMITSMLQDYQEGGWLPMWKNIVGTHADSLIASAVTRNVTGFDLHLAFEAVKKDSNVPPFDDESTLYADREEWTDQEVRAGLTLYKAKGFVGADEHTEAGSRTLAYAYDDYAVSLIAQTAGHPEDAAFYLNRSQSYRTIFNSETSFMEARWANGSWAGREEGWTEGDEWAYTFDVCHDIAGLVELKGGKKSFIQFLDEHFDSGHNDHTNEPSHHIPYLYSIAGSPSRSAERVRQVAVEEGNYGLGPEGLLGNEDCGQMSAWFLFSSLGFYSVDAASSEYIIASPLFPDITILFPNLHGPDIKLRILAEGAHERPYVASVSINGRELKGPRLQHSDLVGGGEIVFVMSKEPTSWGESG
ncbi:glycoside hydrolase family 92 protein [Mrakia frigida]|uniref:GH92 family glycosyl hydrolase n=1 Tax=Mrakia frigida TaxID=29902 RepID=UPI003FCC1CD7